MGNTYGLRSIMINKYVQQFPGVGMEPVNFDSSNMLLQMIAQVNEKRSAN